MMNQWTKVGLLALLLLPLACGSEDPTAPTLTPETARSCFDQPDGCDNPGDTQECSVTANSYLLGLNVRGYGSVRDCGAFSYTVTLNGNGMTSAISSSMQGNLSVGKTKALSYFCGNDTGDVAITTLVTITNPMRTVSDIHTADYACDGTGGMH